MDRVPRLEIAGVHGIPQMDHKVGWSVNLYSIVWVVQPNYGKRHIIVHLKIGIGKNGYGAFIPYRDRVALDSPGKSGWFAEAPYFYTHEHVTATNRTGMG